jgi:hypothetical protein
LGNDSTEYKKEVIQDKRQDRVRGEDKAIWRREEAIRRKEEPSTGIMVSVVRVENTDSLRYTLSTLSEITGDVRDKT